MDTIHDSKVVSLTQGDQEKRAYTTPRITAELSLETQAGSSLGIPGENNETQD